MRLQEVRRNPRKIGRLRRFCRVIAGLAGLAVIVLACVGMGSWWITSHQLLYNANVLTMERGLEKAEALVISRGRIAFVGTNHAAREFAPWYYRSRDLAGRTLLPGFVDAHSHFLTVGIRAVTTDLSPYPAGSIDSLETLYSRISEAMGKSAETDDDWILGFNYDNTVFPSGQHPDRRILDTIAPHRRVFLRHNSGHMGVGNSAALRELLGAAANNPENLEDESMLADPHIGKYPGTNELNGLLQEKAAPSLMRFSEQFSPLDYWTMFRSAVELYATSGYTTVQNGTTGHSELSALRWLSRLRLMPLRVVAWGSHDRLGDDLMQGKIRPRALDTSRFSVAAVKIILDGSPQGYTAWLSEPYHISPGTDATYRGSGLYTDSRLQSLLKEYYGRGWRVALHANGDAAIDQLLRVLSSIVAGGTQLPRASTPHTILVHAQTVRDDQLEKLAELGVTPTFFSTHTYYWGDWHRLNTLGPARAGQISPLQSTASIGLRYSIHSDAPVTSPSALQQLWSATERLTRSGHLLGPSQRVSRLSALRALTIEPAWQNGIDHEVGSLSVGKQADLVELSADPLLVADVRGIKVLRTMVAGRSVYLRASAQ